MRLVSEHPHFGPATPLALLPTDFLDSGYFCRHLPGLFPFNFVEQYPPGNEPIESLLTRRLALHLEAGWPMDQHHTRRRFIHILPAMPSRSHKSFFNIRLTHPQGSHPLGKLLCLIWVHGKCGHCRSLVEQIEILKEGNLRHPSRLQAILVSSQKNLYSFGPFAIIKHACALSFNG
jgi:hypothetical protein